jgi:hypothetical protein
MDAQAPIAVDQLTRELEVAKVENAALEKVAKHHAARLRELQTGIAESGVAAQGRARTIIRRMLDGVYREAIDVFLERSQYSGADVAEKLKAILKKHASTSLKDINEYGLI